MQTNSGHRKENSAHALPAPVLLQPQEASRESKEEATDSQGHVLKAAQAGRGHPGNGVQGLVSAAPKLWPVLGERAEEETKEQRTPVSKWGKPSCKERDPRLGRRRGLPGKKTAAGEAKDDIRKQPRGPTASGLYCKQRTPQGSTFIANTCFVLF